MRGKQLNNEEIYSLENATRVWVEDTIKYNINQVFIKNDSYLSIENPYCKPFGCYLIEKNNCHSVLDRIKVYEWLQDESEKKYNPMIYMFRRIEQRKWEGQVPYYYSMWQ